MSFDFDAIKTVTAGLVAWLFYSLKKVDAKADAAITEDQVHKIISQRVAELKVRQEEAIKDLVRIEAKIDHLHEIVLRYYRDSKT